MSHGGGALGGQLQHESTSSKNSSGVDQFSQQQLQDIQRAFAAAGGQGPSPLLTGAGNFGTSAQDAGSVGLGALGGDPAAVARLMNPYQQQVIDANNANFAKSQQQTVNQTNDLATRAGAFGGSRHGVAEGVALGNNAMAHDAQTAQLLQGGYNGAIGQAAQAAGLGLQGAQLNSNLGFGGVGSPAQWYAQMLKQGFIQPTGTFSDTENHGTGYGLNGGLNFGAGVTK